MAPTAKTSSSSRSASLHRSGGSIDPAFMVGFPQSRLMACAMWDDSIDGNLPVGYMGLGVWLPNRAQVVHGFFNVIVVPVGPTNMVAELEDAGDLITSAAINGAPWSTVGLKHGVVIREDSTAVALSTTIITTAPREIALGATGAVSSAGRVAMYVEYVMVPSFTQGDPA